VSAGNSFEPLEKYFKNRAHPNWNSLLKKVLPNDSFAKPVRFRIDSLRKALSERFSHPYHPDHSPRQFAGSLSVPSPEGIFFWEKIRLLIDVVLWTYYANFPMIFHPKNTLKKFGFNAPVGLFVDMYSGHIVRKSLKDEDYYTFLQYSSSHELVKSLTHWYESLPTLSETQIIGTWNKDEYGDLRSVVAGYAMQMATLRALRKAMVLKPATTAPEEHGDLDYDVVSSYSFWDRMSKRK
jgi:hypothetical protein